MLINVFEMHKVWFVVCDIDSGVPFQFFASLEGAIDYIDTRVELGVPAEIFFIQKITIDSAEAL